MGPWHLSEGIILVLWELLFLTQVDKIILNFINLCQEELKICGQEASLTCINHLQG